jgi:hypothetical protein
MAKKVTRKSMWDVLTHLENNRSDKQICNYLKITRTSLAAYKANLQRQGIYPSRFSFSY